MKRRIIWRIVLGLVILLALALCVTKVIIPLFDTSDEARVFVPDIMRYVETDEAFTLESENLVFALDNDSTHFTVTDKRTGKAWSSVASGVDSASKTLTAEQKRLLSVLTVDYKAKNTKLATNFTSFEYSVTNNLYHIEWESEAKDAIRVTYTIGKISREYIYPKAITGDRMDAFLKAEGLSSKDKRTITDGYKEYNPRKYGKNDDVATLEATYPALKEGVSVWVERSIVNGKTLSDANATKLENAFAAAGYTAEDYELDQATMVQAESSEGATTKAIFNVSVVYRLEGDDLVVDVPLDSITYNPTYAITALNLLPAFGTADNKAEGYILVPEGSGAIIRYNNGKTTQPAYTAAMYGHDWALIRKEVNSETRMIYPVFGMATEGSSFLCILEDGKSWAGVNAQVAGYNNSPANTVNAYYTLIHGDSYDVSERTNNTVIMFEQQLPAGKLSQRYRFIASDSYMEMASAYREYLLAQYPELNREVSAEGHTVVEMVGAIDKVQQVMGVPTSVPIALTTYRQAQELLEKLVAENLPNLSVRYTGWMNGGLNQSILNGIRLMREMGSEKELKAFAQAAGDAGVPLYLDGLVSYARDSGLKEGFIALRDAAKFTTREEVEIPEYSSIWYGPQDWRETYFLLKPALALSNVNVLSKAAEDYGATGVSFRDLGNMLSADYDPKDLTTREQARLDQMAKIDELREKGQLVMTRSGNDYAAAKSDIVTDFDLDGTVYRVIDEIVPFYAAALHGSVAYTGPALNLSEDQEELLLRSAEMGASLQFSLMAGNVQELQDSWFSDYYGADVSIIYDDMIAITREYNEKLGGTFNQRMTGHERVGNVTITEYENGVRVYVNYGYTDAEVDGVTIPARSYETNAAKEAIE
ncbi:MAG: DUF5696 domain-containing protein [Aristaeellaceae bacterium]